MAGSHRYATLVRQSEFDLDASTTSYFDGEGRELLRYMPECPRSYSLGMPIQVNHWLAPQLDITLLRIAQAGLYDQWYRDQAVNAARRRTYTQILANKLKVFSIKDLQVAFFVLVIGYGISILVFIYEINLLKILTKKMC